MGDVTPAKRFQVNTDANFKVFGTGARGKLRLKNISTSGACFKIMKTMQTLDKGQMLFINILHENLKENMSVYAEIIWVKEESEMGVRFMPKSEWHQRNKFDTP